MSEQQKNEADQLLQQGIQYCHTRQIQKAIQYFNLALLSYRELQDHSGEMQAVMVLGYAHDLQGNYEKATEFYEQSLTISRQIQDKHRQGLILQALGIDYLNLGKYAEAIEAQQQSIAIAQAIQDRHLECAATISLGLAHYAIEDHEKAIELYSTALTIAQDTQDRLSEGQALENLGTAYQAQKNYKQATEYHLQSLAIFRELQDRHQERVVLTNLGDMYNKLEEYSTSIDYSAESLTIAREILDHEGEATTLNNLGVAFRELGDNEQAKLCLEQSISIARETKDLRGEVRALTNLKKTSDKQGNQHTDLSDHPKVREYWQQQRLAFAHKIGDLTSETAALHSLGNIYLSNKQFHKAIELYERSLGITRELHDRELEEIVIGSLGNAYYMLGDYSRAIQYYQQRITIAKEIHDSKSQGIALQGMALAYVGMKDYLEAINCLEQGMRIIEQYNDSETKTQLLNSLGRVYTLLEDFARAIQYYQENLKIMREVQDHQGEAFTLSNLAKVYARQKDYTTEITYYEKSLEIARAEQDRRAEGEYLDSLGTAFQHKEDYDKAIKHYQQSLTIKRELFDLEGEKSILTKLGMLYASLEDYSNSIASSRQGLALARAIKDREGEAHFLNNLGLTLAYTNNLIEAEAALRGAIQLQEPRWREVVDANQEEELARWGNSYDNLQRVLIAQDKIGAALEVAERRRAYTREVLLLRRIASAPDEQLVSRWLTTSQMQQIAIGHNATLVEFSIIYEGVAELFIWVISPQGNIAFRWADIGPILQQQNTSLKELVAMAREALSMQEYDVNLPVNAKAPQRSTPFLRKLYDLLIHPIVDLLPTDPQARVIFVPQGPLLLIPFTALLDDEGTYLIEKHAILTASSIQVLKNSNQLQQISLVKDRGPALVVGNPKMPHTIMHVGQPSEQLTSLPHAEKEAQAIAALYKTKAIIGNAATKASVLQYMSNARLLHFATYGLLHHISGLNLPGAIALAPSEQDTGLLTSKEIVALNLKADLIVLSACSNKVTENGIIGLSDALLHAGISSVIIPLWPSQNAPIASFMTEFHKFLYHKLGKAQALRLAMITTMKRYPDPAYWAAFTLLGEA